jgi:hypothetical protein
MELAIFLINAYDFLIIIFLVLIFITIISAPYLYFCWRNGQYQVLRIFLPVGLLSILTVFMLQFTVRAYICNLTIAALKDPGVTVLIENVRVSEDVVDEIRLAFENRRQTKVSGSQPLKSVDLVVKTPEFYIDFTLRQDSRDHNLYWVFIPRSRITGDFTLVYLKRELIANRSRD